MIKKIPALNNLFSGITFLSSTVIIFIILGIFTCLYIESMPAINEYGFLNFILEKRWDYVENIFGGFRPLAGTIITAAIAIAIAIPIALGIAVFITEICPKFLKDIISTAIELLAAIPSIIYGMWGLFTFAPLIENTLQKWISTTIGEVPFIGSIFTAEYAGGVNIFTASLVLSIMIVPYIASITRDTFLQTPQILKESAYGIGATKWEVIKDIVIPYCKTGINSGIIIASGRALGETMAIAYLIGNKHGPLNSVFDPYVTITSALANEFNEASGLHMASLFMLAFILFLSNFTILTIAKIYIRNRVNR